MRQRGFLLLPEEIYVESLHQGRKLICDILQSFGPLAERIQQLAIGIHDLFGYYCASKALNRTEHLCDVATAMWRSEEKNSVCRDEYRVQMLHMLRGPTSGVSECPLDYYASKRVAYEDQWPFCGAFSLDAKPVSTKVTNLPGESSLHSPQLA